MLLLLVEIRILRISLFYANKLHTNFASRCIHIQLRVTQATLDSVRAFCTVFSSPYRSTKRYPDSDTVLCYLFFSYISIKPLRSKSSSTIISLLQRGTITLASPPVAITVHFSPSSSSKRSAIPSIAPAFP